MLVDARYAVATNVSDAWADAVIAVLAAKDRHLVNLILRIEDPLAEDPHIRAIADDVLAEQDLADIVEVANTIFPAEWAADLPDSVALAADYGEHLPLLRRFPGNGKGTYFGRMVNRQRGNQHFDQLTSTIRKLCEPQTSARQYRSIYEIDIYDAIADAGNHRGFPCLSHLGFHVAPDRRLTCLAQYRSHDVTAKGYGNYLGLGRLLGYVAERARMKPGELTVVAGGVSASGRVTVLREAARRLQALRHPRPAVGS